MNAPELTARQWELLEALHRNERLMRNITTGEVRLWGQPRADTAEAMGLVRAGLIVHGQPDHGLALYGLTRAGHKAVEAGRRADRAAAKARVGGQRT